MPDTLPSAIRYTGLTPAQLAFLQQTVPAEARRQGQQAAIDATEQEGGRIAVQIRTSTGRPCAIDFTAGGAPLTPADLDSACAMLGGVEPALVWALIRKVSETMTGFLPDRRPVLLYHRHAFARQTRNRFTADHPALSGPRDGAYGTLAGQHARLLQAMQLDQTAALESCTWGIAQVPADGAYGLGYAGAEAMAAEMIRSEGAQLQALVRFLTTRNLANILAGKDWVRFATIYTGGSDLSYAGQLRDSFTFYETNGVPDLAVREAQLRLTYLGYPLPVDGVMAPHTRAAVARFQALSGLASAHGDVTDATLAALRGAGA